MLPHNTCSMIQNASRAALPSLPLTFSNQNFHLSRLLANEGLINFITLGTPKSPNPQGFRSTNDQHKRIWLQLKYKANKPIINSISTVSKPSKKIFMDAMEIKKWVNGSRQKSVPGLKLGEVGFVKTTNMGWLEARDAARRKLGGIVMIRCS